MDLTKKQKQWRQPPVKSSSASRSDSPSTGRKPQPPARGRGGSGSGKSVPARAQRPSKAVAMGDEDEGMQLEPDGATGAGDEAASDSDDLVEIDEPADDGNADEVDLFDEAEKYDLNDDMSDPDIGHGNRDDVDDDDVVEVTAAEMSHASAAGKRKKKGGTSGQKKPRQKRARCWKYFKLVNCVSKKKPGEIVQKAKCLSCCSLMVYGGGTTALNRHMESCSILKNQKARALRQGTIAFDPAKPGASLIVNHEYNHDECKSIIAKMIIVHEYPFRMVEHVWFNILMTYMNAAYKFIGRKTIRAECMRVYLSEKEILMKQLRSVETISLTCDLWTSNQNICYLAVVAHYIDEDWDMQARVLSFIELDPPHSGNVISRAVFECCQEWKIEDKVITMTMDNASSNDVAADNLREKFTARNSPKFISEYFHVRCCAHIVNLIVNDGIKTVDPLISKLRETVKYLKKSPSRMYKFKGICKSLNISTKKGLCLDVSTRWSSTNRMLENLVVYRAALVEYAQVDPSYIWKPSPQEWSLYRTIQPILASFAEVTTVLSGSNYPTANIFYPYILNVKIAVNTHAVQNEDESMQEMGKAMLEKFDKYWDSSYGEEQLYDNGRDRRKKKNNVMVIASILDPRFKLRLVQYCFTQLYGEENGMHEADDIKNEFFELFAKYEMQHRERNGDSSNEHMESRHGASSSRSTSTMSTLSSGFKSFLAETNATPSNFELITYLEDKNHPIEDTKFRVLDWWRLNAHRFPIVAKMARNFLTIPATSVSSESTFSTGGRVLDDYRSYLRPNMVEALVCASSFIKGSKANIMKPTIIQEEDSDDDVEYIPFPESSVDSC